jgi:hypothetical protein
MHTLVARKTDIKHCYIAQHLIVSRGFARTAGKRRTFSWRALETGDLRAWLRAMGVSGAEVGRLRAVQTEGLRNRKMVGHIRALHES